MAKTKWAELKIGLMVAIGLALLVTLTLSLGNFESYWDDTIPISIQVPSAVGLEPYTKVTYSGVKIGMVAGIEYNEDIQMAVVSAEIDRYSPVATDSQARLTSANLLSPLFLEISGGSEDKKIKTLLREGKLNLQDPIYIQARPYTSIGEVFALATDVKQALGKMESLADELQPALRSADGFIQSASAEFITILREMDELFVASSPRVLNLLDHSDQMIVSASQEIIPTVQTVHRGARELSQTLPRVVNNLDTNVTNILRDADAMVKSVSPELITTMTSMREAVSSLKARVANVESRLVMILDNANRLVESNRDELERIVLRVERITKNLDELSAQLADDPWRLIWKSEGKRDPTRVSPEWQPFKDE
ncbi:MCE family protein [bacterium]|nr:MCE family protein [bacterium]